MRSYAIAKQADGINRLRSKGGASDTALFDLVNGWVSQKGTIQARPGSRKKLRLPAGTIGLIGHQGKHHVFADRPVSNSDARVVVDVLRHPTGGSATLAAIHNAFPVLGRLYVVAEFTDGVVKHYWLDNPSTWAPDTVLSYGARVSPSSTSGFYYRATNVSDAAAWTSSTTKVLGDTVQPSVANGFVYTATAVSGDAPIRTSNTEPTWPTTDGATVLERRYFTEPGIGPGSGTPPTPTSPSGKPDDYGPYPPSGIKNEQVVNRLTGTQN